MTTTPDRPPPTPEALAAAILAATGGQPLKAADICMQAAAILFLVADELTDR